MTNPFGVEHTPISKSVEEGLRMVAAGSKGVSRSSFTGAKKPTSELSRRMAAGAKAGKRTPRNSMSQTAQIRLKEGPLA